MKFVCSIAGHRPSPDEVCNGGKCFTRCERCGAELVRSGADWQPVPKGFRVVWKQPDEQPPAAAPPPPPPAPPPAPAPPPPPPPLPEPAAPIAAAAGAGDPPHILVADDDALVADLLQHRLSGRGYRVSIARDGGEALALAARDRPDAVLLDAMMPMLDGYEVLRRLRADPALAQVPVVMLTARKQEGDIVRALDLGASDFVVKPFIPEELLSRLARLIQER